MIQKILLPKLGQTMEEATLAGWQIKEGDAVTKGQVICEITTDKATLEVESTARGTVRHILAKEGEVVPVNDTIAVVADLDEEIPPEALKRGAPRPKAEEAPKTAEAAPSPAPGKASAPKPVAASAPAGGRAGAVLIEEEPIPLEPGLVKPGRKDATPRARALAKKLELPLLPMDGSGPEGRVHEKDVEAYYEEVKDLLLTPMARQLCLERNVDLRAFLGRNGERITQDDVREAPAMKGGVPEPLNAMRATIANRLSRSMRVAPHFYLTTVIDMSAAIAYRKQLKADGKRVSYNDMLIKAGGLALRRFPRAASAYGADGYVPRDRMNVGFAVAIGEEGLVVPVVRDADRKGLEAVAAEAKELATRARSNKLTTDDYTGGVFTISNLGMMDVDQFTAIINPGEAAILAVGKIQETPAVVDGSLEARPLMKITLSSDHRVIDGLLAAKFNGHIKSLLEKPESLL